VVGIVLLLASAIVSGWVATQIWSSPEWPRQLFMSVAALDVIALAAVLVRQSWSRRVVKILMGIQLVAVDTVLIVAAFVLIRDNDPAAAITLIPPLFGVPLLVNSAVALIVARSIGRFAWLDPRPTSAA
jgi:uncharacterized membrane protein HdeD (DUF308 family)